MWRHIYHNERRCEQYNEHALKQGYKVESYTIPSDKYWKLELVWFQGNNMFFSENTLFSYRVRVVPQCFIHNQKPQPIVIKS